MPAFGIVVAVMGVERDGLGGPAAAVLGKMIGGALVGTFLGILVSLWFSWRRWPASSNRRWRKQDLPVHEGRAVASMNGYAPRWRSSSAARCSTRQSAQPSRNWKRT